ncbi:UDP-glucose:glycoprotein glucosyltransferase-domain-containing protein [Mycena alexandri]|uniref:UDP-glucose:glycoprotein glucosyltransferase-domain-containing protein n=1 Tax=Mycena alexandri TaxID=1745969 RepID=A0AAD6STM3_9AGAR|nr:UDP-glucose:glycoprotein glucosyltransferase-domain-containing protein [Mycena alexandri]
MKRARTIFVTCLAAGVVGAKSPPVKVTLKSSWPAPPLLLEIIETVSLENPDAFFPFVDRVTDPDTLPSSQPLTNEAVHHFALQVAVSSGFLSEPGAIAAVEMSLGLHAATPKIEAFYHHYLTHTEDPKCGSWVDWYGEVVCDVDKLAQLAGIETIDPANSSLADHSVPFARPKILTFDHIHPSPARTLDRPARTAVLYASLDSPNFRELHSYLFALADKSSASIEYVLRPRPDSANRDSEARNFLSGYGVSLDIKKTDYLAVDDRNAHGETAHDATSETETIIPEVDPVLALIEAYAEPEVLLTDSVLPHAAIPVLGFQATQLIADSDEPLSILAQLSQNFPKYMTALSRRVVVNESLQEEVHANQLKAQAGVNVMWLNGAILSEKDINPLGLLRLVRKERTVLASLSSLGLTRTEALDLLTHPAVSAAQADGGVLDNIFDASDRPEDGEVIVWWNDIEKDSRYASWSPSMHGLLRQMYPGQFHNIKLNLFNVVLILDLSRPASLNMITSAIAGIISRGLPFRFGIVPLPESEDGAKMAKLFYHSVRNYGRKRTMGFLQKVMAGSFVDVGSDLQLDWASVKAEFTASLDVASESTPEDSATFDFEAILRGEAPEAQEAVSLERSRAYVERLDAGLATSRGGHGFVNGKHLDVDDNFWRMMQGEVAQQLQHLQEAVYGGKITDETTGNISTYFYDLPTSSLRRNPYIFPASGDVPIVSLPELLKRTGFRITPSTFVYPLETEQISMTMYVVADFDTEAGLALVKEALTSINDDSKTRLTFVHNPTTVDPVDPNVRSSVSWLLSHLLAKNLLSKASPVRLLRALGLDVPVPASPNDVPQIPLLKEDDQLTDGAGIPTFSAEDYSSFVRSSRLVVRELQLAPGEQALVANGRVVGPLKAGDFIALDFQTLESYELRRRTEPVIKALEEIKPEFMQSDRASSANLISMAASVLAALQAPEANGGGIFDPPKRPRQRNYRLLDDQYSSFQYGDNSTALYQIAVIIDPLSEMAQKWSSLLEWLSHIPDIYIKVYTNPAPHEEIPLKRFYRYALLPSLAFDADGAEISTQAIFDGLPIEPIYTLGMDVPPSWLVRPREALYDLDNIQLGSLSPQDSSVDAVFALDYLVVEGHARDPLTNAPPRGVQLQLLNGDSTPVDDTQVVVNLGYLQFKAKPGVFQLEIREGRGRDIFVMESVGNDGLQSLTVAEVGDEIAVTSFEGSTIYPRLKRLPGMETEDVLADPEEESPASSRLFSDIASRVKSIFIKEATPPSTALVPVSQQADINIFTVASGLLYERFVSIMILSVLRNTNSTVKFWFIENFLSPSFLEFIPHLAKAYNFQYELVTYKWPSWLRAQKEKQRIIWAYKILFLDVLFPMDLKKVIFVDADQIVRADLKELVDLDLEGAPYGYTPMGDDNPDMEGFRFWKTGYWKDFLQGRPYHISALYVIDLVRFRQLAAGDILRGQYQQLSADPASLANLDQDLPNNLQREVPIFSLHEDWLWCETWCSKDRLNRAKTIDLCQNPLTKEPKLARARQIPEWEEYDSEISRFARKLAEDGVIRSRIVAADANALAGAGGSQAELKESSESLAQPDIPSVEHEDTPRDEL